MGRIVGMGDVLLRPLFLGALVVAVGLVELGRERLVQRGRNRRLDAAATGVSAWSSAEVAGAASCV